MDFKKLFGGLLLILSVLALSTCKKTAGPEGSGGNPPTVTILSPTGESTYPTATATITLSGIVSSEQPVDRVMWSNDRDGEGTASGTENWTASNIPLETGDNKITVTAQTTEGLTGSDILIVTYNPYLLFLDNPRAQPPALIANQTQDVRITIPIASTPNFDPTTVRLVRLNDQNTIVETLNLLTDDGNLNNGDDIQGDGVFSTLQTFMETTPGTLHLRILAITHEAEGDVPALSPILKLPILPQTTQADLDVVTSTQTNAEQQYQQFLQGHTEEEAKQLTVDWLLEQPDVDTAGLSEDGYNIWIQYASGIGGDLLLNPEGTRGGGTMEPRGTSQMETSTTVAGRSPRGSLILENTPVVWETFANGDTVGSRTVLIFDAYNSQFAPHDEGPFLKDLFNNSDCPNFDITYLIDDESDLSAVQTFPQYGTIILVTHGGRHNGQVLFMTREAVNAQNFQQHVIDLLLQRLTIVTISGTHYFGVLPSYISGLSGTFPQSIIYNGSCESSANATMANAFLGKGAKTYFGFTRVVNSNFAQTVSQDLFQKMVNDGKSTGDAFTPGQVDPGAPHATFTMTGNNQMVYGSSLTNAGFERGDLTGWSRMGDGRVIPQLGPITPQEGDYMAIISTGLGFTTSSGAIRQTFCIPEGTTTLTFKYNFLSEEFLEWCGSQYQDYFDVTLETPDGTVTLLHLTIDDLCENVVPAPVSFDQGDVYMTGWITFSVDISAYAGQGGVTITFTTGDIGDSIFDTAVLVDAIRLE